MSDDERLRQMYRRSMTSPDRDGGRHATGCSSPEDLALLASGEGDEARRLAVLDHVMMCAACQREFNLVRAADRAGSDMVARRVTTGSTRRGWLQSHGALLAAAVVLIAIGLTVNTMRTRPRVGVGADNSGVLRGSDAGDAAGVIRLISPASGAQSQLPLTLVWHASGDERGNNSGYRVEVLDSAGAPVLVQDNVRDTTLVLSSGNLRAGENYSWWVSTPVAGGTVRSGLFRFRLTR